ncbi:MAG: error-prone DNA polymerase [Planctomycetes bacterium]|nr:error-prone DNA polymerase [Planctomycetota bacterium]
MARVLCVALPWFRTERLTRSLDAQPEPELAVVIRRSNTLVLTGVTRSAWRAGIREGMTLAQSRALFPKLEVAFQDDEAEARSLESLAAFAYSFTPEVRLWRPNVLLLEITGCERLHGSEEELMAKLADGLRRLGFESHMATADNATAALTLAMTREAATTLPGHGDEIFTDLPLQALRLDARTERELGDLGVTRIGELLVLPQNTLPHRFGDELVTRLRQLRGELDEDFEVWKPIEHVRERLDFTGPTNQYTSLLFILRQAATFMSERLNAAASGARRLEACFVCTDGEDLTFSLDTARATADAKGLATLLTSRFDKLDRGERWFEAFELVVPSHEPLQLQQRDLFEPEAVASGDFLRLLDELTGRLGRDAVARAVLTDNPLPKHSFRYVPFQSKEQSADRSPIPGRPEQIDRSRYVSIEGELNELPSWWDFSRYAGAMRVVLGPERLTLEEPTDHFTVEAPDGSRHWVSFTPGAWWVPKELAGFRDDFRAFSACGVTRQQACAANAAPPYAELVCFSNFSFLRGASTAEQLFKTAADLGLRALAITDLHSMAGIVRAHVYAKQYGVKLLVGTRIPLIDGPDICLYAMNRKGYGHICRLLTKGKMAAEKGRCNLHLADVPEFSSDVHCVVLDADAAPTGTLAVLREVFGEHLSLAVSRHFEAADGVRAAALLEVARALQIPAVTVNDAHWHEETQKFVQDVQSCIREGITLDEAHGSVFQNAERRLKRPAEMAALFPDQGDLLARSVEIADACNFSMDELRYEYPDEVVPVGSTMQEYLEQETWAGAARRYPDGVPEKVRDVLKKELRLIDDLKYAAYFLTVYDIVKFARGRNILCQGRGSAANSSVCFCLGVTSVDPMRVNLVFERFLSRERNEPPDIDIDFEHERREEVLQYIYNKYGRHRTGITATTICYRTRSLVRDVGKACGLSLDQVERLSKSIQWWDNVEGLAGMLKDAGLDPQDSRVAMTMRTMEYLRDYPRHLSQHVGGFVITRGRLDELVPIENAAMEDRTVIEWNKDDIDALGILKVDCLSLGMLTACHKAFDLIRQAGGGELDFVGVFDSDPEGRGETAEAKAIYGMLHKADAIGTFQVESRAQMSMLPRLRPREFYDLVIEVAIVRPGPIQGGMVHPYLRRRNGEEAVEYPYEPLRQVLGKTFGVPLFQEQAMQIAVVAGGYSPGEADQLRRDMGGWRRTGSMEKHRKRLIEGMAAKGISADYAERVFQQISGFGEYGFPESHAASFALITYVTCYLKRFYPAALTAALVNSQPMGFYTISTLIRDAREHGVEVRPVDVNWSSKDCTLETDAPYPPASMDTAPPEWGKTGPAIRLGLRVIKGLSEEAALAIERARAEGGPFKSIPDLMRRVSTASPHRKWRRDLHLLAAGDAFRSLGLGRREALWEARGYSEAVPDLFRNLDPVEPAAVLPSMTDVQEVTSDYHSTGLSLRAHPVSFARDFLDAEGVTPAAALATMQHGDFVEVAGYSIAMQRPGTAAGITFVTLEDETGVANLVVYKDFMEANRKVLLGSKYVIAGGKLERQGDVIHVKVEAVRSMDDMLPDTKEKVRRFH